MTAKLIKLLDLAPAVRQFTFEVPELDNFTFVPGQFISVKVPSADVEYTRAYSIASTPNGNTFELCLNHVPAGRVSNFLFGLSPGTEIEILPPLGYFTLRNQHRDVVLIATGTGIAPFRSILHYSLHQMSGRVTLLFGTRHAAGILYHDEWKQMERRYSHFQFWPTLTRPEAGWEGRTGRIGEHLGEALDNRTDIDIYLCGLKAMVDETRKALKERGYDRKQIVYEKYD